MPSPIRSATVKPMSTPVASTPTFVELPMERGEVAELIRLASQGAMLQKVPDWAQGALPADQKFRRVVHRSPGGPTYAVMLPIGPKSDPDKVFLERRISDPKKPGSHFVHYRGPVSLAAMRERDARSQASNEAYTQAAKNLDTVRAPLAQLGQGLQAALGALPAAQAAAARLALGELQAASAVLGPSVAAAGWGPKPAAPTKLPQITQALASVRADLAAQLGKAPAGTPLATSIATALASLERARAKLPA